MDRFLSFRLDQRGEAAKACTVLDSLRALGTLPKVANTELPLNPFLRADLTRISLATRNNGSPSVKPLDPADRKLALRHQQARERSRQCIDLVVVRSSWE
jgi:hypothetical protein